MPQILTPKDTGVSNNAGEKYAKGVQASEFGQLSNLSKTNKCLALLAQVALL